MRVFLPATLVSLLAHGLFVGLLALWPTNPAREPEASEDIRFTLVWESPAVVGTEPQEPPPIAVPVLVEPAAAPPSPVPAPPQAGPVVRFPTGSVGAGTPAPPPPVSGAAPGARLGTLPGLESPRSVVFLFDHSVSTGLQGTFRPAREELRSLLLALPPTCLFQVIPYSRSAEPLVLRGSQALTPADPETVRHVLTRLDSLLPAGSTEPFRAIRRGLQLRPDILVVLTDRLDLHDGGIDEITRLNQGRTALHLIELVRSREDRNPAAAALAERNRGTHRRIVLP